MTWWRMLPRQSLTDTPLWGGAGTMCRAKLSLQRRYLTPRRQSISMPCSKGRSPSGCLTTVLPSLTAGKQKNLTIRSITTTAMPRARVSPFPNVRMNGREKLSADGIRTPILIPHTFPDRKGPSAVTATFFRCSWIRSMISLIREVMCRSRSPQTGFMSLSYMGRQAVT